MSKLLIPFKDVIIQRYLSGESCEKIAADFLVGYWSINRLLQANNIKRRTLLEIASKKRIHTVNENYFDNIDTENKAYWLGFIMADGGITGKYRLKINLKYDDYDHLYKFKKDIQATNAIEYYCHPKKHPIVRLHISSKKLVSSLSKYGVIPNKTFSIKPPLLEESLLRHYWRGMFDGDGCLCRSINKNKYVRWIVHFCGNYDMVYEFRSFLSKIDISTKKVSPYNNIFQIGYQSRSEVKLITKYLYHDSKVYLDRKYDLYLRLSSELS